MERNQWESAAEAILFALGEPVEETRLAQACLLYTSPSPRD